MRRLGLARLMLLCLVALAALRPGAAQAERRLALVIGNSAYRQVPALANPRRDAEAVAETLHRLNFEVIAGYDLGATQAKNVLDEFGKKLEGADVGLFFYAGHGLQVEGRNYLVPVDVRLRSVGDLDDTLSLDAVQAKLEREQRVSLLFIDACRDNPFAQQVAGYSAQRGLPKAKQSDGLAPIRAGASGTLVAFATAPGRTAEDGDGYHSPFTAALLDHMPEPGIEVRSMITKVRRDVVAATKNSQIPWDQSSLLDDFYFKPRSGLEAPSSESELWAKVEESNEPELLIAFLRRFGEGPHAAKARARLSELQLAAPAAPGGEAVPPSDDLRRSAAKLLADMPPIGRLITGGFTYAGTRMPTACGWHLAEQVGAALGGQVVVAKAGEVPRGVQAIDSSRVASRSTSTDGPLGLPLSEHSWLLEGQYVPRGERIEITFDLAGRDPSGQRRSFENGPVSVVPEHGSPCRDEAPPPGSPLTRDETRGPLTLELTSPLGPTPFYEVRQPPQKVELALRLNNSAHLYCFDRGVEGIQKFLPNYYRPDTLIPGGHVIYIPTDLRPINLPEQQIVWRATKSGLEIIKCFASDRPLLLPERIADVSRPPSVIQGLDDLGLLQAMRAAGAGGAWAEASVVLKVE